MAVTRRRRRWIATLRRWWVVGLVVAGFGGLIVLALLFRGYDSPDDDADADDDELVDPAQSQVRFGITQDCQDWRVPHTGSAVTLCADGM